MCFRPATVTGPKRCPKCGAVNPPNATKCKKCNEELKAQNEGDKK